jgi:hypothetical protein
MSFFFVWGAVTFRHFRLQFFWVNTDVSDDHLWKSRVSTQGHSPHHDASILSDFWPQYFRSYICGFTTSRQHLSLMGRAMAQTVSRRPPTAEARVRSRVSPYRIYGGQSGTGTGSSPSSSVFTCQFHSTASPLLGKGQKNNHHHHLHHRVAQ